MILVRVEPAHIGNAGMSVEDRKDLWLSHFPAKLRLRMAEQFAKKAMDKVIGCWFSEAYHKTDGQIFDALDYAKMIADDYGGATIRVLAIRIDDNDALQYRLDNLDTKEHPYAHQRSKNKAAEYLLPNYLPQRAEVILTTKTGKELSEESYLLALEKFDKRTPVFTAKAKKGLPKKVL